MDDLGYPRQPGGADAVGCGLTLQRFLDGVEDVTTLSPLDWCHFYDYVVSAYSVGPESRHRVSELSDLLKTRGLPNHGSLAVLYAHGLYILARNDRRPLYQGGFNP